MKKRARTLVILLCVLATCVGAYIVISFTNANEAKKAAEAANAALLYASGRDAPVKISCVSSGEPLSFVLEDNKWYAANNHDFPLKQEPLTTLAASLNSLTAVRILDKPLPLSAYGLDQPAYTLTASGKDGNVFKMLIGSQTGEYFYAMTEGGNKIYTIPAAFVGDLNNAAASVG